MSHRVKMPTKVKKLQEQAPEKSFAEEADHRVRRYGEPEALEVKISEELLEKFSYLICRSQSNNKACEFAVYQLLRGRL